MIIYCDTNDSRSHARSREVTRPAGASQVSFSYKYNAFVSCKWSSNGSVGQGVVNNVTKNRWREVYLDYKSTRPRSVCVM